MMERIDSYLFPLGIILLFVAAITFAPHPWGIVIVSVPLVLLALHVMRIMWRSER